MNNIDNNNIDIHTIDNNNDNNNNDNNNKYKKYVSECVGWIGSVLVLHRPKRKMRQTLIKN